MTIFRFISRLFVKITLITAVIGLSVLSGAYGQAGDTDHIMSDLRTKYDTMVSLSATFDQTTSSDFMDEEEYYHGDILLQGDSYRIEMNAQTIVSNTELTWVYNKGENQVLINDYVDDETTFSLSRFLSEFDTAYSVASSEQTPVGPSIVLIPHDDFSSFLSVQMWIRESDSIVSRLRVIDINNVIMSFDLSGIVFNPRVPEQAFQFVTPAGVEEIDLREN
jgi:outer membrane lipoprotein carrier protein